MQQVLVDSEDLLITQSYDYVVIHTSIYIHEYIHTSISAVTVYVCAYVRVRVCVCGGHVCVSLIMSMC